MAVEIKRIQDGSKMRIKPKEIISQSEEKLDIIQSPAGDKIVIFLEGLDCANCASKIEREIRQISGVMESVVDFVSKKLKIEITNACDRERIIEESKNIIVNIEPEVKMRVQEKGVSRASEKEKDTGEENAKGELIRLVAGAALFGIAVAFKFSFLTGLILYLISYVLVGGEVLLRAIRNIAKGQVFDENFLMSLATVGAFSTKQFPEAVAVMLFYQVGELFQDMAVNRSRKSIASLMDIRPDFANLRLNGEIKRVSPEEIKVGDIIVVKPGEKVPLDGIILEGSTMVDTSALTGESVPREMKIGDSVLGGFINKNGLIAVRTEKEFGESTVAKILDLVENASSKKARAENFITRFARLYTPVVVISALLLAFLPPLFTGSITLSQSIYRALVFLVVSCPCALVISIPLSFFGGIGGASRNGILVKGGNYLEALNEVEFVVFDKTGTLTRGEFKVTDIKPEKGRTKEELLEVAAYAESFSNHPIAASIMMAFKKAIDKSLIESFNEVSGNGVKAIIRGEEVLAGNFKLMKAEGIKYTETDIYGTVIHVAVNKEYAGFIVISDEAKEDSKKAISELKASGIKKTVMLTGDNKNAAGKIGKELGLDEIYAELLPVDKVKKVEELESLKSPKGKIIFVGDGINDAPVLARADIGIAMGGIGSDAAIEAADVVIMTDEPSKIVSAIKIARKTKNIVMQNIIFALGVKIIILLLGALGIATMWEAVFGDVGVALIAVLNAMRAMKLK